MILLQLFQLKKERYICRFCRNVLNLGLENAEVPSNKMVSRLVNKFRIIAQLYIHDYGQLLSMFSLILTAIELKVYSLLHVGLL